jgi:hypothetical protein
MGDPYKALLNLQLESPSKESESDHKNFIIFIPSRNSSLTCCQLWAIGDHHHVLKSSFVFSKFSALTGNLSGHELKMEKSPALMENVLSSGWELENVWREVSGLGIHFGLCCEISERF